MKKQKEQVSKQNRVEKENSMPREVQQRENKRRNKIKRSRTLEKRGETGGYTGETKYISKSKLAVVCTVEQATSTQYYGK